MTVTTDAPRTVADAQSERHDVIRRLCRLQEHVCSEAIGFSEPNDCFCQKEPGTVTAEWRSSGTAVAYIEAAVAEKIARDKENADVAHESFKRALLDAVSRLCAAEGITVAELQSVLS